MVALDTPITAYDLTYDNAGTKGVVRIDAKGVVINNMNWLSHAAAVVPPGKLVIRVNLGCVIDYTDESGTVWLADRMISRKAAGPIRNGRGCFRRPGR